MIHERALVVVNAERGVDEPSHTADYRIDLSIRVSDLGSPRADSHDLPPVREAASV